MDIKSIENSKAINLSFIASSITTALATACGGIGQISNTLIAHCVAGHISNSLVLSSDHAEILIFKIWENISNHIGEFKNSDEGGKITIMKIDVEAESSETIKLFKEIYYDPEMDKLKNTITAKYKII